MRVGESMSRVVWCGVVWCGVCVCVVLCVVCGVRGLDTGGRGGVTTNMVSCSVA